MARCRRCALVFASDLPSPGELSAHYANYPEIGTVSDLTVRRYRELLARLEQFRQTGRLLDVGCGDGHFLVLARQHGWQVYGSEYGEAPRQRAQARGLDVRSAPFPQAAGENGTFDAVTALEVLEHVPAPLTEAYHVKKLLRTGGCFYLTTPNFASISRRLTGPKWRIIEYPEHLTLFTPRTLDRMLVTAGFGRLSVSTTGISLSDIWAGVHPTMGELPPQNHDLTIDQRVRNRTASSRAVDLGVRAVNVALSWFAAGDTIKAFYLRP